jgi:putative membrane protein
MASVEKTPNELAVERTDMAAQRSMMAADRSLMAWIRTGLSMISFGFTIYKVMESFITSGNVEAAMRSPRAVGMFLTGLGTVAIVMGTVEYWFRLRDLRVYGQFSTWRPSFAMAIAMSVTGVFLFVGIISRVL